MMEIKSKRKIDLWLSIFIIAVVVLLSGLTYITGDLSTYMATPLAISENVFSNDFSIMEFTRPNAQSVSDNIMALFLRIGIPWQALSIVGYIIIVAVFAAGVIAISKRIAGEKYYIVAGVLIFFSFYAVSGLRIGRNPIWYPSFYYAQAAFCIAVWGVVKALDRKWYIAFILFAIATLIHFTAGSYCAAFALIFVIIDVIKTKRYKLLLAPLIWVVSCFAIFGAMYLSGTTGSGLLSSDAFVKIHAYLRHPHHHVPSSWEKLEWLNYICYIGATFLVMRYALKNDELYKKAKVFFILTTALMAGILIINYIGVEVVPIAMIAKLQPARCVFVYRFLIATILALSVYHLVKKKEYYPAALIIFMTALPQFNIKTFSGILLLLVALYLMVKEIAVKKDIISLRVLLDIAAIILVFMTVSVFATNIAVLMKVLYIVAFIVLLVVCVLVDELSAKKGESIFIKIVAAMLAITIVLVPMIDMKGNFQSIGFKSARSAFTLSDVDFSAQVLAERFEEKTDKDALFLGDPNDITTSYFRIFSLRSTVVAFKNMPFTDEGMLEWVKRLKETKALSVDDNGYYVRHKQSFDELTPQEIVDIAKEFNAGYILVDFEDEKVESLYESGTELFDSQGRWKVLKVN